MNQRGVPQVNGNKPDAQGEPEWRPATNHVGYLTASRLHHGILADLEIPRRLATRFPGIHSSAKLQARPGTGRSMTNYKTSPNRFREKRAGPILVGIEIGFLVRGELCQFTRQRQVGCSASVLRMLITRRSLAQGKAPWPAKFDWFGVSPTGRRFQFRDFRKHRKSSEQLALSLRDLKAKFHVRFLSLPCG